MVIRNTIRWLFLVLLLTALAACGGAPTETAQPTAEEEEAAEEEEETLPTGIVPEDAAGAMVPIPGEIPVYPAATQPESGSQLALTLENTSSAIAQARQQTDARVAVEGYAVPGSATFAEVQSFYSSALTGQGWQALPDASGEVPTDVQSSGSVSGWSRGANNEEEFIIVFLPAPSGSTNNLLITVYGSKMR